MSTNGSSRRIPSPDQARNLPPPRLKDSDPSLEDVRDDYAEAIAERVSHGGLYAPPSGNDGIYVATVRAIVRAAALSPALASRKVFVIGDAERMVPQEGSDFAANAFLKLLEEPPANTTLVLTSSEPGALLPTIRSRVVSIRVAPVTDAAVRELLSDPIVKAQIRSENARVAVAGLVESGRGAPGTLLARSILRGAGAPPGRLVGCASGA